jgi:malonyl-CoA O-methyltransferase
MSAAGGAKLGAPSDKARVARAFSRAAADYEARARVQRRAAERLFDLALGHAPAFRSALDVGAGTGALLSRLGAARPGAQLVGVDLAPGMVNAARARAPRAAHAAGDAEALPVRSGLFDLVVSTSALQWLSRLDPAFTEARRALVPGGVLAVALFGGATLHELRAAWGAALPAGEPDRTHHFHSERDVAAALAASGLTPLRLESERVVERHADPLALLRSLKSIGAANAAPGPRGLGAGGLGARATLDRMAMAYRRLYGDPDGVPATWDILYAVARR